MISQLSTCTETESAQILDSGFWILKTGLTRSFACGRTPESASGVFEFLFQPSERFQTSPQGTGIYLKAVQFYKWSSDQNVMDRSDCYPQAGLWFRILLGKLLNTWFPHPECSSNAFGDNNEIFRWQETLKGKNHALLWWLFFSWDGALFSFNTAWWWLIELWGLNFQQELWDTFLKNNAF